MSLISIIKEIGPERQRFTDSFRDYIRNQISEAKITDSAYGYLKETIMEEV